MKRESPRTQRRIAQHIANLASKNQVVAGRAEHYLIRYGSRALPALIGACDHPSPTVRFRAVWALGYSRDPDAYETVLKLCKDPDERVRYDSLIALGILGDVRGLDVLIRIIEFFEEDDDAAGMGLWRMLPKHFDALEALFLRGDSKVRYAVINTVGQCAEEHGIARAIDLLNMGAADESEHLRADALYWLEKFGEDSTAPQS